MQSSYQDTSADAARRALAAHPSEASDELSSRISDLVTDLGHLCDVEKLDFVEAIQRALRHWAVERIDPNSTLEGPVVEIYIGAEGLPPKPKPLKRPDKRKKSRPA